MDQTREELLRAWMSLSAYIRGNRLLRELSMNEMLVCNLLYRRQEEGGPPVTATELCARTQLLKSQVNHILTAMESRRLIERARSHAETVLDILEEIRSTLGEERTRQLTALMDEAVAAVNLHQKQRR